VGLAGLLSFGITFLDRVRGLTGSNYLNTYWQDSFAPLPTSSDNLGWYLTWARTDAWYPLGLHTESAWVILALPGVLWLAWRRPRLALYLLSPVAFMLVASTLHRYPITGRLLLFMAPTATLLLTAGIVGIADVVSRLAGPLRHLALLIGGALTTGVLLAALPEAQSVIDKPYPHPEDRPVFDFIQAHWRDGDRVYVYGGWALAQRYYAAKDGVPPSAQLGRTFPGSAVIKLGPEAIQGLRDLPDLRPEGRVWVVSLDSDRKRIADTLDSWGTRLGKYNARDTGVLLYGFNACTGACLTPVNDGDPD
jgi:hypothetical protein